jgi:hypothetical protein
MFPMTRNPNIFSRLASVKGVAALSLALTALVLPACGNPGEEDEGLYNENDIGTEEEVFDEDGLENEDGIYQEDEEGVMDQEE